MHALLLACLLMLSAFSCPAAGQDTSTEYRVKAAFLYNFARFTGWPQLPEDTFNLCVIGTDPFEQHLGAIAGKEVHGRIVIVTRLQEDETGYDCQLVYFAGLSPAATQLQHAYLSGRPVLTVSSRQGFIDGGGMVGFLLANGKVRFEINLANANSAGLSISSKLLSLATRVQQDR